MSCAKSARCSGQILLTIENTRSESALLCGIMVPIREVTEHVFDSPEEKLKSQRQRRQNASASPLWLFAIIAGHSFTKSGLKWTLYAFVFLAFPAHGDPLRLDAIAVLA